MLKAKTADSTEGKIRDIQNKFETSKQRKIKKNDRGGEFKIYCKIFVNVTMYP
jgi:hypothetical protein